MNDKLNVIWDFIVVIAFIGVRIGAIWYGLIGIMIHQTEFIAIGILLYLVSNTCEKTMDERLKE